MVIGIILTYSGSWVRSKKIDNSLRCRWIRWNILNWKMNGSWIQIQIITFILITDENLRNCYN